MSERRYVVGVSYSLFGKHEGPGIEAMTLDEAKKDFLQLQKDGFKDDEILALIPLSELEAMETLVDDMTHDQYCATVCDEYNECKCNCEVGKIRKLLGMKALEMHEGAISSAEGRYE